MMKKRKKHKQKTNEIGITTGLRVGEQARHDGRLGQANKKEGSVTGWGITPSQGTLKRVSGGNNKLLLLLGAIALPEGTFGRLAELWGNSCEEGIVDDTDGQKVSEPNRPGGLLQ
eukprot:CAMPEP_0206478738 /NCGR_PEP_ID=MMETSP0324_2-20121206/36250_1 /ASSEMBLY_ACC=CAM_ASM_000836 /TAXON_ID=2866 /ORGANISM="Crypthecodinium cohnii, Strain Seligo" /LENGTH=114 /DNA_ID=CAMNT_0053955137 /DNA_START=594 /DNA_END=937 /DNA_ORIENTATION=-